MEMRDPRGPGKFCLATVQAVHAQWLCLRLDGCDASNDQWLMADDDAVQHVGFTAQSPQGHLEPPVGYQHNIAKFQNFLEKRLEEGPVALKPIVKPVRTDAF